MAFIMVSWYQELEEGNKVSMFHDFPFLDLSVNTFNPVEAFLHLASKSLQL